MAAAKAPGYTLQSFVPGCVAYTAKSISAAIPAAKLYTIMYLLSVVYIPAMVSFCGGIRYR